MSVSRLPSLPSLRAFEAAARRKSFKGAAEELFVTPSAISHHVRQLGEHLGLRLLDRNPRTVALTSEGRVLFEAATAGFEGIARAADSLRARIARPVITLSSTAAFLSHWLMPRLDSMQALLPNIDLRLQACDRVEELRGGIIDVAIRYGQTPQPDTFGVTLCDDMLLPVCSPALQVRSYDNLKEATLIHVDGVRVPNPPPSWGQWCMMAGVTDLNTEWGVHLPDSMLAVQAALAGQGIVIASRVLCADLLKAGLLVAPFELAISGAVYRFVWARERAQEEPIAALRRWFLDALSAPSTLHQGRGV